METTKKTAPAISHSTPQGMSSGPSNCGNKNCPRHGPDAMNSRRIPTSAAAGTAFLTGTINVTSNPTPLQPENCKDKNCPKHGQGAMTNKTFKVDNSTKRNGTSATASNESGNGRSMAKKPEGNLDKEVDDLMKKTQQMLRVSAPAPKQGGTNNVVTFITNNHSSLEAPFSSMSSSPSVSPIKQGLPSSSGIYDQMRMEHAMKENVLLQSVTLRQGEEIAELKNQIRELESKVAEKEQEKIELKAKNKKLAKLTIEWNNALKDHLDTIKNLKSKLYYTDLKAKQLKRMASESAATASKWRAKVMESMQAQKELEEKKTASEKASLGLYRQFRKEENKMMDSAKQSEVTVNDLDSTVSTAFTVGTLDTTMLESASGLTMSSI